MTFIVTKSIPDIEKEILQLAAKRIDAGIVRAIPSIKKDIKPIIRTALTSHPTYNSLISGELRRHFGFESGLEHYYVDPVVDAVVNGTVFTHRTLQLTGRSFSGGLKLEMVLDDYSDLLKLKSSIISTQSTNLAWLEWLLIKGNTIIISDFVISVGHFPTSRSGEAIMIKSLGASWAVPSAYAGDPSNNWITQSLSSSSFQDKLTDMIGIHIKRYVT